jgi:hypothetical protein
LPVNLDDLGLIYDLMVRQDGLVYIEMTLTSVPGRRFSARPAAKRRQPCARRQRCSG